MSDTWQAPAAAPRRRPSPRMLVGVAAGVLVLAVVGAAGGWLLAGDPQAGPSTAPSNSPSANPTATPTLSPTPGPSVTLTSPPPSTTFALPDLRGMDFEMARRTVRELRLGWDLRFAAEGEDRTVARTEPAAGAQVRRGRTIRIFVNGAAPLATVPSVVGMSCSEAGALVVEHGLYPQYRPRRFGFVISQEPEPPGNLHWNDRMVLNCGDRVDPSPTASP